MRRAPPIARVPFDPRRLEALATYAEAHRPSPYVNLPIRRLLSELAPREGVIELRVAGRTAFVAAVVDRCDNLNDAAMLEVLGWDDEAPLAPLLAAAIPIARDVARAAGRGAVSLSLPARLVGALGAERPPDAADAPSSAWRDADGSYVLERDLAPFPSPALPPGARWVDLSADRLASHHACLRAAFVDDPHMMIPDYETFAAAALRADPPVRLLVAGGEEVGFARVTLEEGGRLGYVATIGRAPTWRGRGLGAVVLAEALRVLAARRVERFRLGVTATNAAAIALYRRTGFEVVEAWRGWLHPVDASPSAPSRPSAPTQASAGERA